MLASQFLHFLAKDQEVFSCLPFYHAKGQRVQNPLPELQVLNTLGPYFS